MITSLFWYKSNVFDLPLLHLYILFGQLLLCQAPVIETAAVVFGQTVLVAEKHTATALNTQQFQLSVTSCASIFVHYLLLLLHLWLVLRGRQKNRLGFLLWGLNRCEGGLLSVWKQEYFLKHWEHMWAKASEPWKRLQDTQRVSFYSPLKILLSWTFIYSIITNPILIQLLNLPLAFKQ